MFLKAVCNYVKKRAISIKLYHYIRNICCIGDWTRIKKNKKPWKALSTASMQRTMLCLQSASECLVTACVCLVSYRVNILWFMTSQIKINLCAFFRTLARTTESVFFPAVWTHTHTYTHTPSRQNTDPEMPSVWRTDRWNQTVRTDESHNISICVSVCVCVCICIRSKLISPFLKRSQNTQCHCTSAQVWVGLPHYQEICSIHQIPPKPKQNPQGLFK